MTAELRRVVDELRAAVSSRAEWHMLNSLPAGSRLGAVQKETLPPGCRALLEVSDGPTCGDVTIFSAAYAPAMQFQAEPVAGMALPLNRDEWFCCGAVRGDPGPGYLRLTGCDADDQWARLLASVGRL